MLSISSANLEVLQDSHNFFGKYFVISYKGHLKPSISTHVLIMSFESFRL